MPSKVIQGYFAAGGAILSHRPPATAYGPPAGGKPVQPRGQSGGLEVNPALIRATGPGKRLPANLLAHMERSLGADFSDVCVHVGPQAERIGAIAFTTGSDLFFAPGRFQPDSVAGRQLIGHELAHVVQQRQGRVRGATGRLSVVQDQALEAEADRLGHLAAAGSVSFARSHSSTASSR